MKRKGYFIFIAVLIAVAGYSIWRSEHLVEPDITSTFAKDPYHATYQFQDNEITLVDGHAEEEVVPGTASLLVTQMFGIPVEGDLNADGIVDAGVMLVQTSGGSGSFYYVAAAMQETQGYRGTNAMLLGDRVAPQNIEIRNGVLIANYAERASGESFATAPSIGVSKFLIFENGELKEISKPDGF